jgi:hypothetical protein
MAVFNKGGNDGLWFVFKSNPDDDLYKGGPCGHRFDDKPQTPCYRAKEIVIGLSDHDHNQAIRKHCEEAFGDPSSLELCRIPPYGRAIPRARVNILGPELVGHKRLLAAGGETAAERHAEPDPDRRLGGLRRGENTGKQEQPSARYIHPFIKSSQSDATVSSCPARLRWRPSR